MQIDSLRTQRFKSYVLALVAVVVVGVLGIALGADVALVVAVLGHIVALAWAAIGAGAWHDAKVRSTLATVGATPPAMASEPKPPSTPDPSPSAEGEVKA